MNLRFFATLFLAFTSVLLPEGCSTKALECDRHTLLVTLQCGGQSFEGGELEISRLSDGKAFSKSVSFKCPGSDFVFRLNVVDYKAGDKYSARFLPSLTSSVPTFAEKTASEECLAWTLKIGSIVQNDGGSETPDPVADAGGDLATSSGKEIGASCQSSDDCASGVCADGVCCRTKCDGACVACNLSTSLGQCKPISRGIAPTSLKNCETSKVATCGSDGTCDGEGACAKYQDGTICDKGHCAGGDIAGRKTCKAGTCTAESDRPCSPFLCNPATLTCFGECMSNEQCVPGRSCDTQKSCGKKPLGSVCQDNGDCLSAKCVDRVCCNTECAGTCVACIGSATGGADGTCANVLNGKTFRACANQGQDSCGNNGMCDGTGTCKTFSDGTTCSGGFCNGGTCHVCQAAPACSGCNAAGTGTVSCANDSFSCRVQTTKACPAPTDGTASCVSGGCIGTCPAGKQICNGSCIDNQAKCNGVCGAGYLPQCSDGSCMPAFWSFESGTLEGWDAINEYRSQAVSTPAAVKTDKSYVGSYALAVGVTANFTARNVQVFAKKVCGTATANLEGKKFSARVYFDGPTLPTNTTLQLDVDFRSLDNVDSGALTAGKWIYVEGTFAQPNTGDIGPASQIEIYAYFFEPWSGTIRVDDIRIK